MIRVPIQIRITFENPLEYPLMQLKLVDIVEKWLKWGGGGDIQNFGGILTVNLQENGLQFIVFENNDTWQNIKEWYLFRSFF